MTTLGGLVFLLARYGSPLLVVGTCVLFVVTQQPRWLRTTVIALSGIAAGAFAAYWLLWGRAFEYADTYRPVPPALDWASNTAVTVFMVSSAVVVVLGASRFATPSR